MNIVIVVADSCLVYSKRLISFCLFIYFSNNQKKFSIVAKRRLLLAEASEDKTNTNISQRCPSYI